MEKQIIWREDVGIDGGSVLVQEIGGSQEIGGEGDVMIGTENGLQADPTLRLYAIVRSDLEMSPGKLASQAGHAYLNSYLKCLEADPQLAQEYQGYSGTGTKVCLQAPFNKIYAAYEQAIKLGIPCDLIIDSGHVMPPHFNGDPIITALGIGPILRQDVHSITKRFQVVK